MSAMTSGHLSLPLPVLLTTLSSPPQSSASIPSLALQSDPSFLCLLGHLCGLGQSPIQPLFLGTTNANPVVLAGYTLATKTTTTTTPESMLSSSSSIHHQSYADL